MSRTIKALRFSFAAATALLAAALVPVAVPEPGAGRERLYGTLSALRSPVPVAPEILIVRSAPRDAAKPFQTMELAESVLAFKEFEAGRVLALAPLEGARGSGAMSRERRTDLEARFDKEFSLISKNIATLFDAIRLGSVRTKDTARFVDELLALVENSRARLLEETLDGGDAGILALSQAIAALGPDRYATDPAAFGYAAPEYPEASAVAELPGWIDGAGPFRRLDLADIVRYSSLDKALYGMLYDMERAGYMAVADPGAHPPALFDHALALRQDMLERPSDEAARAWRDARERYLSSAAAFLSGRAETDLLVGFEGVLASETLGEAGTARIRDLRRGVVASFAAARSAYAEFAAVRSRLKGAVRGSTCILGSVSDPGVSPEGLRPEPAGAVSAAALANATLGGRFILAPRGTRMRTWLLLPAAAAAGLLALFGTAGSILAAIAAITAAAGLFTLLFLFRGVWIDPAAAAAVVALAAAASLAVELASRWRVAATLRRRTGDRLPDAAVAALAAGHELPPVEDTVRDAVIVSVRHAGAAAQAEQEDGERYSASLREFHASAAAAIKKRGGVILSADGFIVTAGFGTPLQPSASSGAESPACAAFRAVSDVAREQTGPGADWLFGIDSGECRFMYSRINGYGAVGRPLKYARLLSGLASKYGCRILVTGEAAGQAGDEWSTRRHDSLVEKATGVEYAFFELIGPSRP